MNVLVVMRVYSGLADSLASGEWRPRGVPAIYRLLEGLAARSDITPSFVFLARDFDSRFARTMRLAIAPLGERVWILPWRRWPLLDRLGTGNALREAEQALRVLTIAVRTRAQVAYCTNAAYVAASLLARLRIAPVVLRFLGIFPVHKEMAERRGHMLARWFYRAPFSRAICTLEGSGADYYLPKLLRPGVTCDVALNGVDRPVVDAEAVAGLRIRLSPEGRPVIGFLGRLDPSKGCDDFVEALILLERRCPGAFAGLIIGDGAQMESIAARLADAGLASRVHLVGSIPHHAVPAYLAAIDVYVSLNRFGNLSNANLEAMIAGRCMLMLEGDRENHIDDATERMVPRFIVERIPRQRAAQALCEALERLIGDEPEIRRRASATAALAASMLADWTERVEREIAVILTVGGAVPAAPARVEYAE